MGRAWKPIRYLSQLFMRWPWRTQQDWEWGHKSCRRTPQLLPVSACGKDIEMFSIATTETLSLEVFVLLFCLLWGFVNVSLSNKLLAACKFSCFWKVNPQHCLLQRKATLKKPIISLFIGFSSFLKVKCMIYVLHWTLKMARRCGESMISRMCSSCRLQKSPLHALINYLDCSWSEIVNVARAGRVFPLVQGYLN